MALDPSIILQAGRGVTPIEMPMDIAAKGMAMRNMLQTGQLQALQIQAGQQAQQDNADFRARYGVSPGVAKAAKDIQLADLQAQKAKHDAIKASIDEHQAWNGQVAQILQGVRDQPTWDAARAKITTLAQQHGQDTSQGKDPEVYDPAYVQGMIKQNMSIDQNLKAAGQKLDADRLTWEQNRPTSDLGKLAEDFKAGRINKAEYDAGVKKATHIAPSVNVTMPSSNFDPSQPLPPALESQARATAETGVRLTPSSRNPQAWLTNARADFLAQQAGGTVGGAKITFKTKEDAQKYWTTGAGATAARQQETILHHADVFTKIFDALDNGNIQLANKLGNQFGTSFGSDQAQNAKIAGTILSAEVGKYLAGGQSTEAERAELAGLIPTFSSPQQAKGGLQTLKNLVEGQRRSWQLQRDSALKGQVPGMAPAAPAAPKGGGMPVFSSPNDPGFRELPPGSQFKGPDGIVRVKHG